MSQTEQVTVNGLFPNGSERIESCSLHASDKTVLMEVGTGSIGDLCVHDYQTNHLMVVKGSLIIVTLQNQSYEYIFLDEHNPTSVKVPPGIPHSFINFGFSPCQIFNDILFHESDQQKDCYFLKSPFPYDIARVIQLFQENGGEQRHHPMLRVL